MLYIPSDTTSPMFVYEANRTYLAKHTARMASLMTRIGFIADLKTLKTGDFLISRAGLAYQVVYASKTGKTIKVQYLNNDGKRLPIIDRLDRDKSYYRLSAHQFNRLLQVQRYYDYHREVAQLLYDGTSAVIRREFFPVLHTVR